MLDNAIFTAVRAALLAGYALQPAPGPTVQVIQDYQPDHQSAPSGPALLLHMLPDRWVGSPLRKDIYDGVSGDFRHEERQEIAATIQATGIFRQTASDTTGWTAKDVATIGAMILQSDATMAQLRAAGLKLERVTQVRNPFMTNDRQEYEAVPSFDFVLTHTQTNVTRNPAFTAEELRIRRV